jgi:hypothetical protein
MTLFIRRLHNLPILCLLILCLLTSPSVSFGYVWCVSADGHATLEEAVAGDCGLDNPPLAAGGTSLPSLAASGDDCGPCLDVSPSRQWGSPRGRQNETPVSIPAEFAQVAVVAQTPLPGRLQTNHFVANPILRTPETILSHRTIVLLI